MFDIYLSPPHPAAPSLSRAALDRSWSDPTNPDVRAFERELSRSGGPHVAALSSGTAALHLSLVLLGVKSGDEVLCQSSTYVATANPILYQGATPVFVDSEPMTWAMCPNALETALRDRCRRGKRPKAVIVVDSYGMPARFDPLQHVCDTYEVPLIEDAAEGLGAAYDGKACGTLGRMGVWSFNRNKIITTLAGGALISPDDALIRKARFLATQAREPAEGYVHAETGYNYQLNNLSAALGREQLATLTERVDRRRATFGHYRQLLAGLPGISFQAEPADSYSNRWLTALTIDPEAADGLTAGDLLRALRMNRIEARPVWNPMHRQPIFKGCALYATGVADRLSATGLCLPSGTDLTPADRERVAAVIHQVCYKRQKAGA